MNERDCISCGYRVEWEEGNKPRKCPNCGVTYWHKDELPIIREHKEKLPTIWSK